MKWQHSIPAAFLAALTIMLLTGAARAETVSIDITAEVFGIITPENVPGGGN